MGYHSEPKKPEEIREIFREVQAAKIACAEFSEEARRLDRELNIMKSRYAAFRFWTGLYSGEAKAACRTIPSAVQIQKRRCRGDFAQVPQTLCESAVRLV